METELINNKMHACLKQYWGYSSFRPLQEDTINSILTGKESLTVLPTGGGKSLCFQLPAMLLDGMAVVISPLISLMKDQVDSLTDMGIPAAYLNSSLTANEQRSIIKSIRENCLKLLYISPERLQNESTLQLLQQVHISFFVIDEAHCISHWGHDFREDYRNLKIIKIRFTASPVHAFTATATKEVQGDIVNQLALDNPQLHIGYVDRPNLIYRVMPRSHILNQITNILDKHPNEPGIIYCLRRRDVDDISEKLNVLGIKNLPYHAGLTDEDRHAHQDAFVREEVDIIIATVAFGMGIDRSNIRFIIHAAMPKNIEYYHQETGRAGRDGLPSYCYMFYGGGDYRIWSFFLDQSLNKRVMMQKLGVLYNFCTRPQCRHKLLVNYFNQTYDKASCEACDYCLGEVDMVDEPLIIAQKILSCVVRAHKGKTHGFGAAHITNILKGNTTDSISRWKHQELSTFGIMSDVSIEFIRFMIEQLVGQLFLTRHDEFLTLSITDTGHELLQGKLTPTLAKPLIAAKKKQIAQKHKERKEQDWAGVDNKLFQLLRKKRTELAQKKGVPAFIIFGDKSLKDMASIKPTTKEAFAGVFGVGEQKLKDYADIFTEVIRRYAGQS
ncbi:MAG: DNA helicase RecQ [bacterium]